MSDVTQVEVEPQKTAFISRPYSREEKLKQEEEELQELVEEQKQDASSEETENEPTNAEERTFKKRYSDLRRHQQKQTDELKAEINTLKLQLEQSTKKQIKLPKSDEDIETWARDYPDVAGIVETIAIKKAAEQQASLEEKVKALNDMQQSVTKQRAETELLQLHPDFDDIRNDDDFHTWAEEQPTWIQNALYENDDDAHSAARAIDLYKADRNITAKKSSSKDAARSVSTKGKRSKPASDDSSNSYKESDVQRMSASEYEKHSDDIMEAIRNGKFIYDVSGSAR
tara:strand:+ start:3547 stop:4401 length:855 start_codon:yes stop_codon:yes gene_type:complete